MSILHFCHIQYINANNPRPYNQGDDSSCRCEDPLQPADRGEYKSWVKAHGENKRNVNKYTSSWEERPADVAFLGESLVEEMDGRWLGMTKGEHLEGLAKLYGKHFSKYLGTGADIEGVPLGIAGDTTPSVLWRLLHGEMPEGFNPRVWWVSLGMNDIARMHCSEEVVIMGILRVVEEIRAKKPDAKIVINSLLPMHDMRSGAFPLENDYKDAFRAGNIRSAGDGGRFSRGKVINTQNVDASHFARNPSKAIQGEREGDTDTGKRDKFPKRSLRSLAAPGGASVGRGALGRGKRGKLTPEEKRAAELAEKRDKMQELIEKRRAFMQKQLQQRLKNDKVNPVLRDRTKYKRLDPKKFFLKPTDTPLWPAINVINNNLRRFCEKHDHVTFFDATDIFAERTGPNAYILKSNMISVRGHPTEAGFRAWEEAVAAKLKYMLKDKPALVGSTQAHPEGVLPQGEPVVPSPPGKPSDDSISRSELSADESTDGESADDESEDDEESSEEISDSTDSSEDSASEDEGESKADDGDSDSQDDDNSEESAAEAESESGEEENESESADEDENASTKDEEEDSADAEEDSSDEAPVKTKVPSTKEKTKDSPTVKKTTSATKVATNTAAKTSTRNAGPKPKMKVVAASDSEDD
mmetsp:Transcript_30749/g.62319  ORF Transcript_30749/g.62319 Transcript_30749/m.62319 type:complete len:642 (-) Transcript_30749:315-2240(-)